MSSEYPGRAAPPDGYSRVEVWIDQAKVDTIQVPPDDGVGRWTKVALTDPSRLRRLRGGVHKLRIWVRAGPHANGVALYGREAPLNREPVERPGPIVLTAYR